MTKARRSSKSLILRLLCSSSDTTSSFAESEIVTLLVGSKEFPFRVHKDLLLKSGSNFFVATSKNFSEAQTNTIRLPEDDVLVVRVFVEWLYSRKSKSLDLTGKYSKVFVGVLVFGDKIGAEGFLNDLMDALRAALHKAHHYPTPADIIPLYDAGLRSSPFYQFSIKSLVHNMHYESTGAEATKLKQSVRDLEGKQGLIEDIFAEIVDTKPHDLLSDPASLKGCHFHQHKEGSKCAARKK